jgi:hypothetical protein
MSDYFDSKQYRKDYNNILQSLLLLSQKIESVATEIRQLRIAQTTNLTNAPQHPQIFLDDD